MRPLSVSAVKSGRDDRQAVPREGSRLREVYDRLMDGQEVTGEDLAKNVRRQLEDSYGLEFRQRRRGHYFLYLS